MSLAPLRRLGWALFCLASAPSFAAEAERIADDVHLGVASCATSQCHGKRTPQTDSNVRLNEYRTWVADDRHARAYRTLESEASVAMARKLGLESASSADICLDCHADNVPAEKRGAKFQLSDGVGCEACHGGSERWLRSHAEADATHEENLALGMYPTEAPLARASICLSCHLGTDDRFATHEIMGAGHPRLTFELEYFTATQPAHYDVDEDYVARKRDSSGFVLWLTGQLRSARRQLELIEDHWFDTGRLVPELAFYDCHSCHHPMDDLRWTSAQAGAGVKPGTLRMQDQHLRVLAAVSRAVDEDRLAELQRATAMLTDGGQTSVAAARAAAQALRRWLDGAEDSWAERRFSAGEVAAVRKALIAEAARGRMADYADAEQVFFAMESLSFFLGDNERHQQALDDLFDALAEDSSYDPQAFLSAARRADRTF